MKAERTRVLAALVLVAVAICAVAVVAAPASAADDVGEETPWGADATAVSEENLSTFADAETGVITLDSGEYYIASDLTIDEAFLLGEDAQLWVASGATLTFEGTGLNFLNAMIAGASVVEDTQEIAGQLDVLGNLVIGSLAIVVDDSAVLTFHAGSTAALQFGNSDPNYIISDENESSSVWSPTGILLTEGTLTCEGFSLDVPGMIDYVLTWILYGNDDGQLGELSYTTWAWSFDDDDVDKALAYINDVLDEVFDGAMITLDGEASVNDINMIQSFTTAEVSNAVSGVSFDIEIDETTSLTLTVSSELENDLYVDIDWLREGSTVIVSEGSVLTLGDNVGSKDDLFNFLGNVDNNGTIEIYDGMRDDQDSVVTYSGTIDNEDGVVYIYGGDLTNLTIVGGEVYVIIDSTDDFDVSSVPETDDVDLQIEVGDYMAYVYETATGETVVYGITQVSYTGRDYAGSSVSIQVLQVYLDGELAEDSEYTTMSGHNIIYQERADAIAMNLEYGEAVNAGDYYVYIGFSITAEGNGDISKRITVEEMISFPILQAVIDPVTIAGVTGPESEIPDQVHTGEEILIDYGGDSVVDGEVVAGPGADGDYYLYDEDGNILDYKFGQDFVLVYEDNINTGTATVTVDWIGNYTTEDEVTGTFDIVADIATVTGGYQDSEGNVIDAHVGQVLDESNIVITAVKTDGETEVIQAGVSAIVEALGDYVDGNDVFVTPGEISFTADITYQNETYECAFTMTVQDIASIEVVDGTYVDEYEFGDELDTTGMVIVVTYEDGCYAVFYDDGENGFQLFTDVGEDLVYYEDAYESNYTWVGEIVVTGTTVTGYYTVSEATDSTSGTNNVVADLARYLGAMYRSNESIASLTYDGTEYTWNAESGRQGSNWENGTTTLVSAITNYINSSMGSSVSVGLTGSVVITVTYENGYSYDLTLALEIVSDSWTAEDVESEYKVLTDGFMEDPDDYFEFDPTTFDNVVGEDVEVDVTFVTGEGSFTVDVSGYAAYYVYDADGDGIYELYAIQVDEYGEIKSVYGFSDQSLLPEGMEFSYWMLYTGAPVEGEDGYSVTGTYTGTDYLPGATYEMGGDPNVWGESGIVTFVAVFAEAADDEEPYLDLVAAGYIADQEAAISVITSVWTQSDISDDISAETAYIVFDVGYAGNLTGVLYDSAGNVVYSEGLGSSEGSSGSGIWYFSFADGQPADLGDLEDGVYTLAVESDTGLEITATVYVYSEAADEEAEIARYLVVCEDEYEVDDEFDFTVYAIYDDGTYYDVTADATYAIYDNGVAIEGLVFTEPGLFTVNVYVDGEDVYSVTVTVSEAETAAPADPAVTELIVYGETEYEIDDELDITVKAVYSDGSVVDVTDTAEITGFDSSAAGTQTVTVSYENATATIDVTVFEASTGGDETEEPDTSVASENVWVTAEKDSDSNSLVITFTSRDGGYIPSGTIVIEGQYKDYVTIFGISTWTSVDIDPVSITVAQGTAIIELSTDAYDWIDTLSYVTVTFTTDDGAEYTSNPQSYTVSEPESEAATTNKE